MKEFALGLAFWGFQLHAATALKQNCELALGNPKYSAAVETVAHNMGYDTEQLCALPRLLDLHVEKYNLVNEQLEIVPHVRVTLHYNEYSCQYFVRDADQVVTDKNCYNTF